MHKIVVAAVSLFNCLWLSGAQIKGGIEIPVETWLTYRIQEFLEEIHDIPGDERIAELKSFQNYVNAYATNEPWLDRAYYTIGLEYYKSAEYLNALSCFRSSVHCEETVFGNRLMALQMQLMALRGLGRTNEALLVVDEIVSCSGPDFIAAEIKPRALLLKAEMLASMGQDITAIEHDDAYRELDAASLRSAATSATLTDRRARALARNGDIVEAIETYSRFLRDYPEAEEAPLFAMESLRLERQTLQLKSVELNAILATFTNSSPASMHVVYELAQSLYREGDIKSSISNALLVAEYTNQTRSPAGIVSQALRSSAASLAVLGYERVGDVKNARATAKWLTNVFENQPEVTTANVVMNRIEKSGDRHWLQLCILLGCFVVLTLTPALLWARAK